MTATAFADKGPTAQLTVKVENAPAELYCLDTLAEGEGTPPDEGAPSAENFGEALEQLGVTGTALYHDFLSAISAGWRRSLFQRADGPPVCGRLTETWKVDR